MMQLPFILLAVLHALALSASEAAAPPQIDTLRQSTLLEIVDAYASNQPNICGNSNKSKCDLKEPGGGWCYSQYVCQSLHLDVARG